MYSIKKILVVDDNPYILSFLVKFLEKEGFEVISQHGGKEAIEFLLDSSNLKIDLVITDDILPVISGLEFANTLKQMEWYKDVPIILYTQRNDLSHKTRGYEVFDAILYKPDIPSRILAEINRLCQGDDE